MERTTIQVGLYEVNCTVLAIGGKAWIVDPGQEAERIVALLKKKSLAPGGILLTHAHFDHIGGISGLQKAFPGLPVYVHPADMPAFTHPMNQFPPAYPSIGAPKDMKSVAELKSAAELAELTVIETPGHTPGGVCYRFPGLLLSGDTLFAGSVGRTDFPGGDMATLMRSLTKLTALPDDTEVIPGHGPFTTIGQEKRGNPFLR